MADNDKRKRDVLQATLDEERVERGRLQQQVKELNATIEQLIGTDVQHLCVGAFFTSEFCC